VEKEVARDTTQLESSVSQTCVQFPVLEKIDLKTDFIRILLLSLNFTLLPS